MSDFNSLPFPMQMMQFRQMQQQQAARRAWGPVLQQMMQNGGGIAPPPPGTPAGGPQAPGPGISSEPAVPPPPAGPNPMAPGGASIMAPPAGAPMSPTGGPAAPSTGPAVASMMEPYKAMPTEPVAPPPDAGATGTIAPPPAAAAPSAPRIPVDQFGLPKILDALQKSNVPLEKWSAMLDSMPDAVKNNAAQQIRMLHEQNATLVAWANAQSRGKQADAAVTRAETGAGEAESKDADRKRRADIRERDLQRKIEQYAGGGPDNLKRTEFEKDADGNVIGVTGVTKSGKIIRLDADGNPRQPGGTPASPKADQNRLRQQTAWRQELATLSGLASPTPTDKTRMEELKDKLRKGEKPGAAAAPGAPKKISSKAEFDALQPNTPFIDARDGQTKIKGK